MNKIDFVGNKSVVDRLFHLLESGRFPHALLIEGESGIGKKALARELARAIVCRGDEKPCGECSQCRKAYEKIHPDIKEYIPSGSANSFHIDTVREIIDDAYMRPNEAEYKIYILADIHCMNMSAQNAILKILEEPPAYAVFIMTASSKSALLPTVLSRCVCVTLDGVSCDEGASYIASHFENNDIDYETAHKALETFGGNIGKALAAIGNEKTVKLIAVCNDICKALADDDEYRLLTVCSAFQKDRQGVIFACDFLKKIFRDALVYNDEENNCISGQKDCAELLRNRLSRYNITKLSAASDEIKKSALMNANDQLLITEFCSKMKIALGR